MVELYLGIIVYVSLTIWLTSEGKKRNIGWVRSFIISALLTPLIGFIVVYNSSKKIAYHETHFKCKRCGFEFTEYIEHCPHCEKEGHKVKLKNVTKVMT